MADDFGPVDGSVDKGLVPPRKKIAMGGSAPQASIATPFGGAGKIPATADVGSIASIHTAHQSKG